MACDCYSTRPLLFHSLWNLPAGHFPLHRPFINILTSLHLSLPGFWVKDIVLIVCTRFTVYSFLINFSRIGEKRHYHCISKHITCCLKWLRSQRQFCWRYFLSSLLCVSVSPFFPPSLCLCSDRCQLYSLCWNLPGRHWPCYPALMSTPWLLSGGNYPTFRLQSGKKKSKTEKCRAWLFVNPCALFMVWLLLLFGETQGQDCVDKTLRVLTFQPYCLFSFPFFFSLSFLASVLFGGDPDDGVVLLGHMQSPGSPGTPVSLAGEGLLGAESQLWGSGEVPTLWSRPLGCPAQAQTQLGMEPVLRFGGVHRKWTTLCWQGKLLTVLLLLYNVMLHAY